MKLERATRREQVGPNDAMGKLPFTTLTMFAEFEADLTRMRTGEGMKIAKAKAKEIEG